MEYFTLGKLDTGLLGDEFGLLHTDEVIVTDERLDHIKTHHPQDYALFDRFGIETVNNPDEILADSKHPATVFLVKR